VKMVILFVVLIIYFGFWVIMFVFFNHGCGINKCVNCCDTDLSFSGSI